MGLLDSILGSVMASSGSNSNPLVQVAMQMLQGSGGQQGAGLNNILDAFKQGGLGHLADSWVSTGANLPVSAEQISQVLGSGKLGEIASQLGLPQGEIASGLSQILPELINHVTPNGQVPESSDFISNALSMFLKR